MAAVSATDGTIQKKIFGSGHPDMLAKGRTIIANEEMDDIMKIIRSLEELGFLINGASKTIKN